MKKDSEKAIALEKHSAIIANHFLLLEKLTSNRGVHTFRGVNLATDQPLFIKYISRSTSRNTETQKFIEHNFFRQIRAYQKLQQLREQRIEEGDEEIDKFFVKVYQVVKGNINHFAIEQNHFSKKNQFSRHKQENVDFMVMRYIEGTNLKEILKDYKSQKQTMPEEKAISILQSLLEAIEYCHKQSLVHRDICPSNILITKNSQVRLNSLGLAIIKELEAAAKRRFIGEVHYTAPEGILLKSNDSLEKSY